MKPLRSRFQHLAAARLVATAAGMTALLAPAETVGIDASLSNRADGSLFAHLVASLDAPDLMGTAHTGYEWHAFTLAAFSAAGDGSMALAFDNRADFARDSDDGNVDLLRLWA